MPDQPPADQQLSRRALLRRAGLAGGSLLTLPGFLAACGSESTGAATSAAAATESPELAKLLDGIKSKQVIVATYGGTTEDARKEAFWDPFTKRTGVRVVQADADYVKAQDMLQGKTKPIWDAYHGSPEETRTALRDGNGQIPQVPQIAREDLVPSRYRPYEFQSFILAYVPAVMKGTPKPMSWADFFDLDKIPGKRIWPGSAYTPGTREAALLADGVAPEDIYPLDLERADRKIKSIFDEMIFYDEYPQIVTFLTSKAGVMSLAPNGIYKGAQDKGVPLEVAWDCTPINSVNSMTAFPGAPNMDAVMALAAFCNDPARQATFAKLTNYGPPTTAAFGELSAADKQNLPNAPGRTVLDTDVEYLGDNGARIQKDNQELFS